jgi:hypothetical protein
MEALDLHMLSRIVIQGTEDDVVFRDCNHDVYKQIGWLIYRAAGDAALFQRLQADPKGALLAAGVPEAAIANMEFNVVQDVTGPDGVSVVNLIVPEVKAEEVFPTIKGFDRYLVELGVITVRACKRGGPEA